MSLMLASQTAYCLFASLLDWFGVILRVNPRLFRALWLNDILRRLFAVTVFGGFIVFRCLFVDAPVLIAAFRTSDIIMN